MKKTFKTIKEEVIEERKIIDGIKKGIRGVVDVLDAALVPRGLAGGGKKCACRGEGWVNCECSKSNRKKKKEEIKEGQGIYRYPEFNKLRIDIEHAQKTGNGKGVVDAKDALKKWAKEKGININNDPDLLDLLSDSLVIGGLNKCECKECKGKDCKNCECKDCECAGCEGRIKKEGLEEIKTLVDQILEEGGDVFKKHQMKIAKDTLKMSDAGAKVAGGMSKEEARNVLKKAGWGDAKISKLEESEEAGILEEKKGKKKKKKGKKSRGVIGYGFGYNNDDTDGDGDSDGGGISEGQVISDAVGEFFELMVNLPIHSAPPLYFWKQLMENANIAKSAYDKSSGIGRN